jgi:isopentenyldiphosphate isomerase
VTALAGRVAVVDAENRFVRWEDRRVVHAERLPHRTIHVMLFDGAGKRLLVQRRHRAKLTHAGHWDLSCAGHVEEEDHRADPDADLDGVYEACARRELREELGVDVSVLEPLGHFAPEPGVHYEAIRLLRAHHDGPFVAQPDEVEELRFVLPAELEPLAPKTETLVFFARLARERGWWAS